MTLRSGLRPASNSVTVARAVEDFDAVLARALRELAPEVLESRYLAPALRERLSPDDEPG